MEKTESKIDVDKFTYEPEYEIGTIVKKSEGFVYKYVKIVLGIYLEGEACLYQWFPWNGMARLKELQKTNTI